MLRASSHVIKRYYRWGIIGTGRIAEDFVTALKLVEDAQVVAVCSTNHEERAKSFAEKYKIPKAHASTEELCADPEVEIVYVASLHPYHKNGAILALQNGKHVLVEKPFGMNATEAKEMIDMAKEKNLFLMEAMWTRYFPIISRIRQLIAKGKIGKVTSFQASFGFKADPTVPRLSQKALGAGALLDVGVYVVSLASMIFGGKEPQQIRAIGELDADGVDQQIGIVIGYSDGIAILHTAFNSDLANEATIIGTEGRIKIHKPMWCPTRFSWHLSNGEADEEDYPLPKVDGHFNFTNSAGLHFEAKYVQQAIAAGKTESDLHTLQETLQIIQTMDEVREQIGLHYGVKNSESSTQN